MMGGDLFIVTYIFHKLVPGKCNLTFSLQNIVIENIMLYFPGANILNRHENYTIKKM